MTRLISNSQKLRFASMHAKMPRSAVSESEREREIESQREWRGVRFVYK